MSERIDDDKPVQPEEVALGARFWWIKASTESESYGSADVQLPRLGQIIAVNQHRYVIATVSDLFEEGYDSDPNASSHITCKDLFRDEVSAYLAFAKEKCLEADSLESEAEICRRDALAAANAARIKSKGDQRPYRKLYYMLKRGELHG